MVNLNFTPIFDPVSDEVHINVSQMIAAQPLQMTTQWVWIIMALSGILLLIYSVKHHEDAEGDLCGILASIVLLVTSWQSYAVDTVTGYGVTGLCETMTPNGVCTKEEWVLLESHQVYHYDIWGYIFAIFFIISIANLIWLWLDYRRIANQTTETMDHKGLGKPKPEPEPKKDAKDN